jgi:DNA-binding beta-propeller fold protein YncE
MRRTTLFGLGILLLLCLAACSYRYRVDIQPSDARVTVDGASVETGKSTSLHGRSVTIAARRDGYTDFSGSYQHAFWFGEKKIAIQMQKRSYPVEVSVVGGTAAYRLDQSQSGTTPFSGTLEYGTHHLVVTGSDKVEKTFDFEVTGPGSYQFRPQSQPIPLQPIGVFASGRQPKQVLFSPDDKELLITLLDGKGFQILDLRTRQMQTVEVETFGKDLGFVEDILVQRPAAGSAEKDYRLLVSQMTTGRLHEYRLKPDGSVEYVRSIKTGGEWSKVIAYLPQQDLLAVSNWLSNNVTIIDYASAKIVHTLGGLVVPRGLAFTPDGKALAVASFDGGFLTEFDTQTWTRTKTLQRPAGAAPRHIVVTGDGKLYYVSDMARDEVLKVDQATFKILHVYPTRQNTNSIDLSSDGRLLAISCRGPNNAGGYLLRSPSGGFVMIYDTRTDELVATIEGGLQPTGLDISNDDKLLAFSNFQDPTVEIYSLEGLLK